MQDNTIPQPPNTEQNQPSANPDPVHQPPGSVTPLAEPSLAQSGNHSTLPEHQDNQDVIPDSHAGWRSVLSTIGILLAAPLIALFLTAFVFQSYEVDGPSMLPTLSDNDRLIVNKTGKTLARLRGKEFIPKRGEIVIFHRKGLFSYNEDLDKQLIKRVVALPGERVVVTDGVLIVYNEDHPDGFQPDKEAAYGENIDTTPGNVEYTVQKGQVFVAGDNRPNSLDSREFGPIDDDDIVGVLSLRIFPINQFDSF